MLIVGEKEAISNSVGVRSRKDGDIGAMSLDDFRTKIKSEKASKFGLKNFILFSVMEVFMLSVPVIVAFLK